MYILIINDGNRDDTVKVAKNWGVNYVVNFQRTADWQVHGRAGCLLRNGADIIVNTDADDQYCGDDIENWCVRSWRKKVIVIGERLDR